MDSILCPIPVYREGSKEGLEVKSLYLVAIALLVGASEIPNIQLKESARVGGIEFTPLSVEVRKINLRRPSWTSDTVFQSEEKYTVLTYRITNVTQEQAIDPSVLQGLMDDQFGNVHHQVMGYEICPQCIINEQINSRELLPGNSMVLVAVFQAPKIDKAELFTIKVSFVKDNKNQRGEVWVMFKRTDMGTTP